MLGAMLLPWSKTKEQNDKDSIFVICRGTVVGAAFWLASIANGGGNDAWGEGFCVEYTALMKIEMFVGDVVTKVTKNTAFCGHGVGGCAPFII